MGPDAIAARYETAQTIAHAAGRLALRLRADPLEVEAKGRQDFVTAVDRAVEHLIRDRLAAAFPEDGFLGEESGTAPDTDPTAPLWVVDPIDGTANFIRDLPDWCVSIGLLVDGAPALGVIYVPRADELFAACLGRGATRDGVPIRVSERASLEGATIALEFSFYQPVGTHTGHLQALLEQGSDYRRNGSAALSLAAVACGRLDGFYELKLSAWDVVAGMALVKEAGGWVSDFLAGDGLTKGNYLLATTPDLHPQLLDLLHR